MLARSDPPQATLEAGSRGSSWRDGGEPGPDAAEVDRIPRLLDPGTNTAAARVEGERAPSGRRALVGLESAPMDALGRAGRVERLTIQPRKKTHECYSKGNRRPAK